jgi:hypothetical protein
MQPMKRATVLAWSLFLFVGFVASTTSVSAETLVVRLQNGRQISATVHKRTDDARLWLQYGTRAVTVIRPVDWQTIVWASLDGEQISIGHLKELVARNDSPVMPAVGPSRILQIPPADERAQRETMANRARKALGFTRRVHAVQFDAALANWDGDVETDGLLLRLFPIDDRGSVAAVSGTLQVEFVTRRRRKFNDAPTRGGSTLDRIGRWTVRVDEADFRKGAATVKLPFQAIHPEFDMDWPASGLVHIRFIVAGDGTFEQSLDGIRARPFSPLRDATQRQSGRRFLPSERTGRGQRSSE